MGVSIRFLDRKPSAMQTEPATIEGCRRSTSPICSVEPKYENLIYRLTQIVFPPLRVDNLELGNLYIRKHGSKKEFVRKIKHSVEDCSKMNHEEEKLLRLRAKLVQKQEELTRERNRVIERQRQERELRNQTGYREPQRYRVQFTESDRATRSSCIPTYVEQRPRCGSRERRRPPPRGGFCSDSDSSDSSDSDYSDHLTRARITRHRSSLAYNVPFLEPALTNSMPRSSRHRPSQRPHAACCYCPQLLSHRDEPCSHRCHHHSRHDQQIVIEEPRHRRRRRSYSDLPGIWVETRRPEDYFRHCGTRK